MLIHINTDDTDDQACGRSFAEKMIARARTCATDSHQICADPAEADAILLLSRDGRYGGGLSRHPLVHAFYHKTFVYCDHDLPVDYLPGLYVSLPRRRFRRHRHRAVCYLPELENPDVRAAAVQARRVTPDLLASFVGARSHPLRKRLFQANPFAGRSDVILEDTTGWSTWNVTMRNSPVTAERRQRYSDLLVRSRFVLCPRGIGTASVRLFEAMQVGRVPVILSDEWVPPDGPDWTSFAIFVREEQFHELPAILARYEPKAASMGEAARRAWESYFAPEVQFCRFAEALRELMEEGRSHSSSARIWWPMKRAYTKAFDAGRHTLRGAVLQAQTLFRRRASK